MNQKMLSANNLLLVKEILHRLEIREPVTVDELIYLHQQASEFPEVDRWVNKLLNSEDFLEPELNATTQPIAS